MLLQDATNGHPLEAMDKARIPNEFAFKMDTAGKVYGSAFVMRMKTEVATLSQVGVGCCQGCWETRGWGVTGVQGPRTIEKNMTMEWI